jgi:outer membrane lipoprotein LolB
MALLGACSGTTRIDAPVNPEWEQRRDVLARISHWEFTGSINVRDASDSHASRIRWQQDGDIYRINLWGTFNVGATQIDGRPGEVMIVQQGQEPVITETPESLLYQELGYELPVSELNYWIKGIPAPGLYSELQFSDNNQVIQFLQAGWQIDYMAYTNYGTETLPTRIRMQKHPLRLDLTRLNWNLPGTGD